MRKSVLRLLYRWYPVRSRHEVRCLSRYSAQVGVLAAMHNPLALAFAKRCSAGTAKYISVPYLGTNYG